MQPPRISLGNLPTPIHALSRLSNRMGKNLYIKRDDYTGTEYSGNKIRKLEYVLADAIHNGCDTVITCGGIQSNHCRATAAACAQLGLHCHVVLKGKEQPLEGNLFLDVMLGAQIHFIDPCQDYDAALEEVAQALKKAGKTPYVVPVGASTPVGALGYEQAWQEILDWEQQNGLSFDTVCIAVGSGGSYAGLWKANRETGSNKLLMGFADSHNSAYFQHRVADILRGMGMAAKPEEITVCDGYVGLGYAIATREEIAQYLDIARLEGIVLDPCYTGKAFCGMLHEMDGGVLKDSRNILFIHTGGLMGWTQAQRDMAADIAAQADTGK